MARPNGVVIVSERYWAFATTSGELHEGEMPVRRSRAARIPLVRGLLQLASSMAPLVRGRGVARLRERLFLLGALLLPFAFVALPGRLELAAGILTTALIILGSSAAARCACTAPSTARSRRPRTARSQPRGRAARPSRFSARCGTNFAALAIR